ncbi:death domain-associated protein 6-like [Pectinophora gossypiella]|uniref:death domain-associated protein 6-like n=1 Tax=Pectinophora gossypiella TaxID=13191 RepID=UPI00214EDB4F|nr:death domain-associated protein 6-like [Pectinophora gossypiella]
MIEGYIILSDDETSNEIKTNSVKENTIQIQQSEDIETIVIDEDLSQRRDKSTNNNNYVPKPIFQSCYYLNAIYKENRYFANFVEKCLELENSDGMTRILNRTLIDSYEKSEKSYRDSPVFKKVMLKALNCLEVDPDHKFSHVKNLVETLKLHSRKKRVQLTTLATNLNGNSVKKRCLKNSESTIIDLDSVAVATDIPVINLDDEQNNLVVLDEKDTEGKENRNTQNESEDNYLTPHIEVDWGPLNSSLEIDNGFGQVLPVEECESPSPSIDTEKIKNIESEIAFLKEKITECEEAEVDDDTSNSPYILCERYKTRVVKLYKELCKLTGSDVVKQRKVRLQVLEGHPAGPVRILEKFINDNIRHDGKPPFPDFCDVVQCVMVANLEDKLGWSKQQVMREATALFTQCGRALQKQRQRREYRDLLARVKAEQVDYDPADEDPTLNARLEANRRIAVKKESDLLERYTILQYLPPQPSKPKETETAANENNTIEDSDEDSNFEPPVPLLSQHEDEQSIDKTDGATEESSENNGKRELEVKVKPEPIDIIQMLEDLGGDFTTTVIDIEDPFLVIEIDTSDDEA